MPRHDDDERETRGRPTGALLLRFAYGAGLIAFGACLGIVIGSLTETPRLLLERLRGPVETVELGTPEPAKAGGPAANAPLERFGELQEGKRPRKPTGEPTEAKPEPELEPPPARVPAAELEPAPPVAAAPAAEPGPAPAADRAERTGIRAAAESRRAGGLVRRAASRPRSWSQSSAAAASTRT